MENDGSIVRGKNTPGIRSRKSTTIFITVLIILGLVTLTIFFLNRNKSSSSVVFGTYRIYTDDPMISMFTTGQDIYFRIDKDKTITYNTTINSKPKFNVRGKYSLDEKTNTLTIEWESGKLPTKLVVEKQGEDYIIKIGNTLYKKAQK